MAVSLINKENDIINITIIITINTIITTNNIIIIINVKHCYSTSTLRLDLSWDKGRWSLVPDSLDKSSSQSPSTKP